MAIVDGVGAFQNIHARVFDQYGLENAVTFDGGTGNDVFRSGGGDDTFSRRE